MTDSAATFLEEYRTAAHAAGRLQAEAAHAEEMRKIAYAKAVTDQPNTTSVAKAEYAARADASFLSAVETLREANLAANEASAQLDYLGKRWEKWRTQEASFRERQKMKQQTGER